MTAVYDQYSMMRCAIATRAHVRQLLLFDLSFQHEFTRALANFTRAQARVCPGVATPLSMQAITCTYINPERGCECGAGLYR